jgi:hypothetical protein
MRKKRILHAIGKTTLGGVIEGFIDLYQSLPVPCEVKILPSAATA